MTVKFQRSALPDPPLMHTIVIPHGYAAFPVLDTGAVLVVVFIVVLVATWSWGLASGWALWLASMGML